MVVIPAGRESAGEAPKILPCLPLHFITPDASKWPCDSLTAPDQQPEHTHWDKLPPHYFPQITRCSVFRHVSWGNLGQAGREYGALVDEPIFPCVNVKCSTISTGSRVADQQYREFHSLILAFHPSDCPGRCDHLALPGGEVRVYNVDKFTPDASSFGTTLDRSPLT